MPAVSSQPPISGPVMAPRRPKQAAPADRRGAGGCRVEVADVGVNQHLRAEHEHPGEQDADVHADAGQPDA
jgi:hypothetical protein